MVAIVGGAKVSTKLDLLGNLSKKVDVLVIGGAMANTFIAAQGHGVGKSLQEAEMHDTARRILEEARTGNCEILLPLDLVVAAAFAPHVPTREVGAESIPGDIMALDVGPDTVAAIEARLRQASTLVWNGPLGAFETPPFDAATVAVAQTVAGLDAVLRAEGDRRRRRHGGGAEACRGGGADDLRLDRRRRLPGMAGGQDPARRRRSRNGVRRGPPRECLLEG